MGIFAITIDLSGFFPSSKPIVNLDKKREEYGNACTNLDNGYRLHPRHDYRPSTYDWNNLLHLVGRAATTRLRSMNGYRYMLW
jgi:hypothetical protein